MTGADPALAGFLHDSGLAGPDEAGLWRPLSGGISSDIWHVTTRRGEYCVKRALAELKVEAEWTAPVERNAYEWAYLAIAERIAPGAVPTPIAHDPDRGLFAMAWLGPENHALWKSELLAGRVDPAFAGRVGDLVGRIHAATARDPELPALFPTDANFEALRIDPYLRETARVHADLADRLADIIEATLANRKVLVHGDVSPKNILVGPAGPVLLDAEVAWYGDPAFDLAFCLNHLVIKARILDAARADLESAIGAMTENYLARVAWEPAAGLERRTAHLLPALALARVDGKSPLEYLSEDQAAALRQAARAALLAGADTLAETAALLLADEGMKA